MKTTTASKTQPQYELRARNKKRKLPDNESPDTEEQATSTPSYSEESEDIPSSIESQKQTKTVQKGEKIKKQRKTGLMAAGNYRAQYRSNLLAFMTLIKDPEIQFKNEHIEQLKRTPFWLLFNAFISNKVNPEMLKKSDNDIARLIAMYKDDGVYKGFNLGGKTVTIRDSDIRLIFGIPQGTEKMKLTYQQVKRLNSSFVDRRFKGITRLSKPVLESVLKEVIKGNEEIDFEDVARIMCLYMCTTLFFSGTGHTIGWVYVKYIEDLERMKKYTWVTEIKNSLMSSVSTSFTNPNRVTGAVLLLLYWLCEHTTLIEPDSNTAFPRFLKWDLQKLKKQITKTPVEKLQQTQVKGQSLVPTKTELHLLMGVEESQLPKDEEIQVEKMDEAAGEKSVPKKTAASSVPKKKAPDGIQSLQKKIKKLEEDRIKEKAKHDEEIELKNKEIEELKRKIQCLESERDKLAQHNDKLSEEILTMQVKKVTDDILEGATKEGEEAPQQVVKFIYNNIVKFIYMHYIYIR